MAVQSNPKSTPKLQRRWLLPFLCTAEALLLLVAAVVEPANGHSQEAADSRAPTSHPLATTRMSVHVAAQGFQLAHCQVHPLALV